MLFLEIGPFVTSPNKGFVDVCVASHQQKDSNDGSLVPRKRMMEVFKKEELLVLHVLGFMLVIIATISLPHLTGGNLVVFTLVRDMPGLLKVLFSLCFAVLKDFV